MKASAVRPFAPLFYARLWLALFKNSVHRALEFRVDVLGRCFTELVFISSQVVFALAIGGNSGSIAGWTPHELFFFFGLVTLVDALFMLFMHENLHEFEKIMRQGNLDFYLLRPINILFLVTLRFPSAVSLINFIYSLGIIAWSVFVMDLNIQALNLALGLIYLILGTSLVYVLNVFVLSAGLRMTRSSSLVWIFFEFYRLSFRPDDFYFSWLRRIILSLIPAAFFASVPAKVFLGKEISLYGWVAPWLLLLVGAYLANRAWKSGLKHYEGALS